jgi:hypothetical protein
MIRISGYCRPLVDRSAIETPLAARSACGSYFFRCRQSASFKHLIQR